MRKGNLKLIEWYETGALELYDTQKDEGEKTDISKANSEKVKEMKAALDVWRKNMDAKMPTLNPNYSGE